MRARMLAPVLAALAAACASGRPPARTWEEYGRNWPQWPYVVRIARGPGELLYYGARHTNSPADAQIDDIERQWAAFRPTIAFNEGGHPRVEASRERTVEGGGEAAFVRFLGARDDVPVTTLDPDRALEMAHLRRRFPASQVKLYLVLRALRPFLQRQREGDVEAETERILAIARQTPGLGGPPRSAGEVAALYAELFPRAGPYRQVPPAWFDPVRTETVLNRISRANSDFRDRFMVSLLARHVADGHRVFAVVGGSHVVMQERLLRACIAAGGKGC